MSETSPAPQTEDFASFEAAVAAGAQDFSWRHEDAEPRFTVGFNRFPPFHLDISGEIQAEWFRKAHEGDWTIEPFTIHVIETLIDQFGCKSALDIGAHFGFLSMAMLRNPNLDAVHAVEMNPESCAIIRGHLAMNPELNPEERFHLHNVGISDFDQLGAEIWYRDMHLVFQKFHQAKQAHIDVLSLRTVCERIGYIPDLIKIDIEGYEAKMVESLYWMLGEARPRVVLELHWDDLLARYGGTRRGVLEPFFEAGYHCAQLNWHQRMPRSNFMVEVTPANLEERFVKPHGMYVLF